MNHAVSSRMPLNEAAALAFRRRQVQIAARTVTHIEGMYEETEAGHMLLEMYNNRPLDEAYRIINEQRVYPTCAVCYHPVLDGKLHDGYCADERQAMGCKSNDRVMTLPEVFSLPRCATTDCHHRLADSTLCSCCQDGLIDSPAKTALITSLSPQPSMHDRNLAALAYAPLYTQLIAIGSTHQSTDLLGALDSTPNG